MENVLKRTDYLFEVSWEVCNKIGGIHTVVATKAQTVVEQLGDNYMVIGPDLQREDSNSEFEEDRELLRGWREAAYENGLRVRVGRWRGVAGRPIVILVDFSSLIGNKDELLGKLWEKYGVDSISGGWDYVEPVLFGIAAGKVVASFVSTCVDQKDRVLGHFHEWMTCSGGLYLKDAMPNVATVFTTHATVMGRCIAGNGLPLYSEMANFNVDELAHRFGVMAKYSIERAAAHHCDLFTTVSETTAKECEYMLGKVPDCVTPNGFEDLFVPKGEEFDSKRESAKVKLIEVAEKLLGVQFDVAPLLVGIGGRYEFKNKGIDEFIDSLAKLNWNEKLERDVLAYIMVPCWNHGPRRDLQAKLTCQGELDGNQIPNITHYLGDGDGDPVVRKLRDKGLLGASNRVKVVFVPCYLNGDDGIFNKGYYDLLIGLDVTVFPSYYEPWGYTPLESIAFKVPTVTTNLAGFGLWVEDHAKGEHAGVDVVERNDYNSNFVTEAISGIIAKYVSSDNEAMEKIRESAQDVSKIALWINQFKYYIVAYEQALGDAASRQTSTRQTDGGEHHEQVNFVRQQLLSTSKPNWTKLMVERSLPERLRPLDELTKNLWWSWNSNASDLFKSIDSKAWYVVDRNPIALLDTLTRTKLAELENNQEFLQRMDQVYAQFKDYMSHKEHQTKPRIAYFSMEYGLHSSLKIYSGGLGILAGDYLKESSDKNVPMTAVGLLYRYGYFTQKLSAQGEQEASYEAQNFYKLPISPMRDASGEWTTIAVGFPGRTVTARVWLCEVGRTKLYLLDADHDLNLPEDRQITHHLYGGDWENRLKQEFLLGIGGIRTLEKLGIESEVYHCNEGHAAFIGLERIRNNEEKYNLSFSEALEVVRSSSLFTTHTPVPAGHDAFDEGMIRQYMSHYPDRLKITWEQFINLGKTNPNDPGQKFSMSFLASNLSQEINGVSWLHGEVSKDILRDMWPGYMPCESHIGYVTNGVHFPTWAASDLKELYKKYFGEEFSNGDYSKQNWDKVYNIPDQELWAVRMELKSRLVEIIKKRVADPAQFKFDSPAQLVKVKEELDPKVLTIGFARRFATYKRAHLLFTNLDRLSSIVNDPQRPVHFVFAGKAHPADKAGQDLIKRIVEVSKMERFVGKIIFLQGYDMEIARRMVQGVDVWMNTPTRPLEASGTSGEKAVMNGVMHFSVLDGWWVEGYKEGAGWMLPMERTFEDQRFQDELDAEIIYTTIEDSIAPMYYNKDDINGFSCEWMATVKNCIAKVASDFTTNRMMQDYEDRYYSRLWARNRELVANDFEQARQIAAWKRRISQSWDKVHCVELHQYDMGKTAVVMGETYTLEAIVDIDGLDPNDIGVELVLAEENNDKIKVINTVPYELISVDGSLATYRLLNTPENTGSYDVATRIYPKNVKLPHRMDMALVKWA